jgi:GH25 family lysozyme M1 (1,4-beta-N-acetylmuramidase)
MLNGIDVSGWQSADISRQVPADFVWVKATEGLDYVSKECDQQVQGAIDTGKLFGFYHFISLDNPEQQADYFCRNTEGYFGKGIPTLDWEGAGMGLGGAGAARFIRRVAANNGVTPVTYMSLSPAQSGDMRQVVDTNSGLWVAYGGDYSSRHDGYVNVPQSSESGVWPFAIARQYTSQGFLNGQGPLDLDVFYGDRSVWDAYAGGHASPGGGAPHPTAPSAPSYPLPAGYYYGPKEGPVQSVSGYYGPYGGPNGAPGLRQWQQQMANRGNTIGVDGLYGPETARIAGNFQAQCGLTKDQLIGPNTWAAAWTAPVTSQVL